MDGCLVASPPEAVRCGNTVDIRYFLTPCHGAVISGAEATRIAGAGLRPRRNPTLHVARTPRTVFDARSEVSEEAETVDGGTKGRTRSVASAPSGSGEERRVCISRPGGW